MTYDIMRGTLNETFVASGLQLYGEPTIVEQLVTAAPLSTSIAPVEVLRDFNEQMDSDSQRHIGTSACSSQVQM